MPSQDFDLTDVVNTALETRLARVYTTMPGRVVSYDPVSQTATIQALVNETDQDESGRTVTVPIPPGQHIPIRFPGSGKNRLTFPIAAGDIVQLEVANCSLDKFKTLGGQVDPEDTRRHDISDAVASPGMANGPSVSTPAPLDATVLHSQVKVKLGGPTGTHPVLTTQDGAVFMNALSVAIEAQNVAGNGPGAAALSALQSALTLPLVLWPKGSTKVEAQ